MNFLMHYITCTREFMPWMKVVAMQAADDGEEVPSVSGGKQDA